MKTILPLGVFALLASALMADARLAAQEPAKEKAAGPSVVRGDNHLIFRVETPLQRLLMRRRVPAVFVAVNGSGCYDKKEFNPEVLEALRRDLGRSAAAGDAVQFSIFFGEGSGGLDPGPLKQALGRMADGLGLKADPAAMEWRNDTITWKQKLAQMDEGLPAAGRLAMRMEPATTRPGSIPCALT